MNDDSQEARYRALAKDAFAAADRMTDPNAQATMRRIAGGYLAMAKSAAKRERTLPGARKQSRPEGD
jgi:hypothetical protein